MDPEIEFKFEGKKYTVSYNAYFLDLIELPDGRILEVDGWSETYPPEPLKLRTVSHDAADLAVREVPVAQAKA